MRRDEGRETRDRIPAATPEIEQDFCSLPFSKTYSLSCCKKRLCVHTTPPFFAAAVPAGITHYTLQARLCAKWWLRPPLETPEKSPCVRRISQQRATALLLLTAHFGRYRIPSSVLAFAWTFGGISQGQRCDESKAKNAKRNSNIADIRIDAIPLFGYN